MPHHHLRIVGVKLHLKPVVVWNCTQRCNLFCSHCYSASDKAKGKAELTTDEARRLIEDVASFGAPVLLFSGGEPLMRLDILELIDFGHKCGIRTVLSTNGTMIDKKTADELARLGLGYAGISLDAADPAVNDRFRGRKGAFEKAMNGIRNCMAAGVKTGIRFTMTRKNISQLDAIFDMVKTEGIPRICFYHLVPAGRGSQLEDLMVSPAETRNAVNLIIERSQNLQAEGYLVEVLTVDNHADGPLLYMKMHQKNPERARDVARLLESSGGNRSGESIACVSWDGRVYPDQFWRNRQVGDVRKRPFSETWSNPDQPFLNKLRERKKHLDCRCSKCRFLQMCNGNLRARAEAAGNGMWGDDPGCYLSDDEISGEVE